MKKLLPAIAFTLIIAFTVNAEILDTDYFFNQNVVVDSMDATLTAGDNHAVLIDSKATELMKSYGNLFNVNAYSQVAVDGYVDHEVVYTVFKTGFVITDDWGDVMGDSIELLTAIKSNTDRENKKRSAKGITRVLTVDSWVVEPLLDFKTNTIMYVTKGRNSDTVTGHTTPNYNAVAMKLTRSGMIKVVLIASKQVEGGFLAALTKAVNAVKVNPGARYSDFLPDVDTVAAFGAGALTYKLLTGKNVTKVAAVGAGVAFLALIKKFGVFLVLIPLFALKKLFKRRQKHNNN